MSKIKVGDIVKFQALDADKPARMILAVAEAGKESGWWYCIKYGTTILVGQFNEKTLIKKEDWA